MKKLLFIVIFIFVFQVGQVGYPERLTDVEKAVLQGDYTGAIRNAKKILDTNISLNQKNYIYYLMGISFLKLTNLNEARYYFGEVVKQNRSFLAVKSKIGIADTYFIDSDFDRAISLYLDVLSDTHNIQNVSSVYYKLAKSYQKNGQWDKARYYFEKIKERYPKSLESHLAEEALKEGEFYFTVQVGSFTSRDNAENLCKKLKLQGFPVFINEKIVEDIRFYRVRVGKYDKLYKARDIKQQLKEKGLPTKIYP